MNEEQARVARLLATLTVSATRGYIADALYPRPAGIRQARAARVLYRMGRRGWASRSGGGWSLTEAGKVALQATAWRIPEVNE